MVGSFEGSIARILTLNDRAVGAGVLVTPRRVLTCAHVIASALELNPCPIELPVDEIRIDFPLSSSKSILKAKIVFWSPPGGNGRGDVAVFELIDEPPKDIVPVRLVTENNLWEHQFRAFGFPARLEMGVWATGQILSQDAYGWLQVEVNKTTGHAIEQGFSGGPLWDVDLNAVVGIVVAVDKPDLRSAFCIPATVLVKSWPELNISLIPPCPYRGLFAFREADAPNFFGREASINKLMSAIRRKGQRLTAVIGPSGSGKTSIVFAGLVPKLRTNPDWLIIGLRPEKDPFDSLATAIMPMLESEMSEASRLSEIRKMANSLRAREYDLGLVFSRLQSKYQSASHILLVVDQFEELFSLTQNPALEKQFIDALLQSIERVENLDVVITLRADFLGKALSYRSLADYLHGSDLKLGPMNEDELRDAIEKPAEKYQVRFMEGLVSRIAEDVLGQPGSLPLLEFALTLLWELQSGGVITHNSYEEIGMVKGALGRHADDVYKGLNPNEQDDLHRVFIQLVQPGDGVEDTRRVATISEIGDEYWPLVQRMARESVRLIITNRTAEGEETAEIVHEALIQHWDELRHWMEVNRDFRSWQEQLRSDLHNWEENNQAKSGLLGGLDLSQAEKWLNSRASDLSPEERSYILQSLKARKIQYGLLVTFGFLMTLLVVIIPLLIKSSLDTRHQDDLVSAGQLSALSSSYQSNEIDLAYLLGIEALKSVDGFPKRETTLPRNNLLTLLGRNPYLTRIFHEHQSYVFSVAFQPTDGNLFVSASEDGQIYVYREVSTQDNNSKTQWVPSLVPLQSGHGAIWDLAFTPEGSKLVTGNEDSTITFWENIASTQPVSHTYEQHSNDVYTIAISPDGRFVASGSRDNTINIWEVKQENVIRSLSTTSPYKHTLNGVNSLAFNRDGTILASGGGDGVIFLWNTSDLDLQLNDPAIPIAKIEPDNGVIWSLAFTPDGHKLAAGTSYNRILVWDINKLIERPQSVPEQTLIGHKGSIFNLVFSKDGSKLASVSKDNTAILWDTSDWRPIVQMFSHGKQVAAVDFNPDGQHLLTGGNDQKVILWTIPDFSRHIPEGNNQNITASAIDFHDQQVVIGVQEKIPDPKEPQNNEKEIVHNAIIFRDGSSGGQIGLPMPISDSITNTISSLAVSPDGQFLVIGKKDNSIQVWDVKDREPLTDLIYKHSSQVDLLVFSPDGKYLASGTCQKPGIVKRNRACLQGEILIWDVSSWQPLHPLITAHQDAITSLAFSYDDKVLVSGSCARRDTSQYCIDGELNFWDTQTGTELGLPSGGQNSTVDSLAFSKDGAWLASGSCDQGEQSTGCLNGEILLWDVESREVVGQPLRGHLGSVAGLAFSPDGKFLASAGNETTILIWDLDTRQPIERPFIGHSDQITDIQFIDDTNFVSGSRDGTIKKWPLAVSVDAQSWMDLACWRVGRNFTQAEWEYFLPREEYRKTCDMWPKGK